MLRADFEGKGYEMCDYSLFTVRNRLAEKREELVVHRFETGARGFASVKDIEIQTNRQIDKDGGFWSILKGWISSLRPISVPAICVPPGARLLINAPPHAQESLGIGPAEMAVFTEISSRSYSYRDALILSNGTQVLLQDLAEGTRALVLSLSSEAEEEFAKEEYLAVSRYTQAKSTQKIAFGD